MTDPFNARVQEQVSRLQRMSLRELEAAVTRKRLAWLDENRKEIEGQGPWSPRAAFELLFFDYMGLSAADLPVVKETEGEIAWLSRNPCPTLEACRQLNLDTRKVCRGAYEKSTQAFLSRLDPQLRFLRSYEEIRPYAPHCAERIVRVDLQKMMTMAIEEAKTSKR
jgi:hypothetical protein